MWPWLVAPPCVSFTLHAPSLCPPLLLSVPLSVRPSPARQYFNINPTARAMTKCTVELLLTYLSSLVSDSVSDSTLVLALVLFWFDFLCAQQIVCLRNRKLENKINQLVMLWILLLLQQLLLCSCCCQLAGLLLNFSPRCHLWQRQQEVTWR